MKQKALVIGGGLAGLATARELTRSGLFHVTVLEVEQELGGRAHTKKVQETAVDFGGFIIFPWYKQFYAYCKELNLLSALSPIPNLPILYELEGDGHYISTLPHPYHDFSWWRFLRHVIVPALRFQNPTYPHLDAFQRKTIHDLLHECQRHPDTHSSLEEFFNIVSQGYCYGSLEEYKASLSIPISVKSRLFGDVNRSSYFTEGMQTLVGALARTIESEGGTIRTSAPVSDIDPHAKTIRIAHETLQADIIVLTQPFNTLTKKALDNSDLECPYTHFAVVTARFSQTPSVQGRTDWGALFHKPNPSKSIQILSSVNLSTLYGEHMKGLVNFNIRFNRTSLFPVKEDMLDLIEESIDLPFSDVTLCAVEEVQFWPNTMPIASESFIEHIRDFQGKNGIYYAGDYLGCPSMETALATGVHVAKLVIQDTKNKHIG